MTMDYLLFLCGFLLPLSSAVEGKTCIFFLSPNAYQPKSLGGKSRVDTIDARLQELRFGLRK